MKPNLQAFRKITVFIGKNIIEYKDWIQNNYIDPCKCPAICFHDNFIQIFYQNKNYTNKKIYQSSTDIICDVYSNVEVYCDDFVGFFDRNKMKHFLYV